MYITLDAIKTALKQSEGFVNLQREVQPFSFAAPPHAPHNG